MGRGERGGRAQIHSRLVEEFHDRTLPVKPGTKAPSHYAYGVLLNPTENAKLARNDGQRGRATYDFGKRTAKTGMFSG